MKQIKVMGKACPLLWVIASVVLVMMVLLHSPVLASAALVNAGMLGVRDGLMESDELKPRAYPHYRILPVDSAAGRATKSFGRAVTLDKGRVTARWALGRAALAAGDAETAAEALGPLVDQASQRPLLYHDVLTALSRGGEPEDVLALYEAAPPPQPTQAVSDTVALAYLEPGSKGEGGLEKAKELRPGDLYLNYHLWKQAQEAGDVQAAAAYNEKLTYFPLEAVNPTDERLLDYAAQVIPELLEEGVWDREKTLNVVSYLVWQHNTAPGVVCLLEDLTTRYPAQPDWAFHLAELYHRRGDLQQAAEMYEQVLADDPEYAQAYLRLGILSEGMREKGSGLAIARLSEAARYFGQYNAMAPDDLLGVKHLTEVCVALDRADVDNESCTKAARRLEPGKEKTYASRFTARDLEEALAAQTDNRRIVAELLDLPSGGVGLGVNLVRNGGFEEWLEERPKWWEWSRQFDQKPFNDALLLGRWDDLQPFEGRRSVRLNGLWVQQEPTKSPARAGFMQWGEQRGPTRPISLTEHTPYVFSVYYRVVGVPKGEARIWVSNDSKVFWNGDLGLPATTARWHHFVAVGQNGHDMKELIRPRVRLFASGFVEFDMVEVRPVIVSDQTMVTGIDDMLSWTSRLE